MKRVLHDEGMTLFKIHRAKLDKSQLFGFSASVSLFSNLSRFTYSDKTKPLQTFFCLKLPTKKFGVDRDIREDS